MNRFNLPAEWTLQQCVTYFSVAALVLLAAGAVVAFALKRNARTRR